MEPRDAERFVRERLFELPVEIPSGLERRDSRKYGITALDFIGYAKNGSNNG